MTKEIKLEDLKNIDHTTCYEVYYLTVESEYGACAVFSTKEAATKFKNYLLKLDPEDRFTDIYIRDFRVYNDWIGD
jgi:hypothetical protein